MDVEMTTVADPPPEQAQRHDLVGGPFAVIESDPGVFTTLLRKLGVRGLEVTEIFDISDPFAGNSLDPRGLVFCYPCADDEDDEDADAGDAGDTPDPDAEDVWFANQLVNDACASQAIVNIVLNLEGAALDGPLDEFRRDTEKMSPLMKGLAFTNCAFIREAHNALARCVRQLAGGAERTHLIIFYRPADSRAALHAAARGALAYSKKPGKSRKSKAAQHDAWAADQDAYHYIGYVPARGKVWELNGLRAGGPLEVGAVPAPGDGLRWMDVVRPALRRRMQRLQARHRAQHIRYNLLAVVEDQYERASDALEMLKRERRGLERRLDEAFPGGWADKVDPTLLEESRSVFATSVIPDGAPGRTFGRDFASRKLEMDMAILDCPVRRLADAWQECVKKARPAKVAVEDELRAAEKANADLTSLTFDYEPFIRAFMTAMHGEGLLEPILTGKKPADDDGENANGSRKRLRSKR